MQQILQSSRLAELFFREQATGGVYIKAVTVAVAVNLYSHANLVNFPDDEKFRSGQDILFCKNIYIEFSYWRFVVALRVITFHSISQ